MTVAAIVIIALLFTTGAVLALAVSADLHAVKLQTSQDQVHYTAESNLARGTAAALQAGGNPCPPVPSPGVSPVPSPGVSPVPSPGISPVPSPGISPAPSPGNRRFESEKPLCDLQQPVAQLAQPAQTLACISINLDSVGGTGPWAVWTVIGARGLVPGSPSSYDTWVATTRNAPCSHNPASDSPVQTVAIGQADATYHSFLLATAPEFLYIQVRTGQVALSPFVVRGASHGGSTQVVTVIGRSIATGAAQSVLEADEADLYLPTAGGSRTAGLWRTVLP